MDTSIEIKNVSKIEVNYKDDWYRFYNKEDYDNWIKTISNKEYVCESRYYKGLGTMDIYIKKDTINSLERDDIFLPISKIYKVIYQTWTDGQMGNYGYETHHQKIYFNKEEAERVVKDKNDSISIYERMCSGTSLKEIDVIFKSDGSYQEVTINKEKKFLEKEETNK